MLDIDTAMGNDTQLGHASSLQSGQRVPDGKHYHGSPAHRDARPIIARSRPTPCSSLRRGSIRAPADRRHCAIVVPAADHAPEPTGTPFSSATRATPSSAIDALGRDPAARLGAGWSRWRCWSARWRSVWSASTRRAAAVSTCSSQPEQDLRAVRLPLLAAARRRDRQQFPRSTIVLFGDSSAIVHYMRFIGWKLNKVEQTGSNFGTNQKHDNPFLCEIGSGTMVSDGLSMINVQMSSSRRSGWPGDPHRRPQLSRQQHPLSARRRRPAPTACSAPR